MSKIPPPALSQIKNLYPRPSATAEQASPSPCAAMQRELLSGLGGYLISLPDSNIATELTALYHEMLSDLRQIEEAE